MKFIKVNAGFEAPDIVLAEDLICNIFFSFNLKGVVCNVPIDEPDEGFGTNTLEQPDRFSITGFFPCIDSSDAIIESIRQQTEKLEEHQIRVTIDTEIVDEADWADAWKDFFEVTPITHQIIVKPDWKPYEPNQGEIIIHLDPGMAFGTGTHPTTAMCIQLIEKYLAPGSSFLDIGTGSGILMITAGKLGASELTGIDTDETVVSIAETNLAKNDIPSDIYALFHAALDQVPKTSFDVIAANIIAQVIVDIAGQIKQRMNDRSIAVLSGIITDRLADVLDALDRNGFDIVDKHQTDEWVALAVKLRV